jgi:uncharacterized protein (TIGR03437 family)
MSVKLLLSLLLICAGLHAQFAIVNGASFRTDQPLSPGAWATATGTFTGVTTATAPGFPLPKTLGQVKVTVDNIDAPVYYVSSTQVNFLIPYAVTPGLRAVKITSASGTVNGTVRVISTTPGIFVLDRSVTPPTGAIINQDGFTVNTSANPAKRGDIVSIYGTGPGDLTSVPDDGAAPGYNPLRRTVRDPQVFINGVEAKVVYSGLNSDAAGLWQINVTIPNLAFVTGRVPVQVFMDGVDSNEVSLFVQ